MRLVAICAGLLLVCLLQTGCITQRLTRAIVEAPNLRTTPEAMRPGNADRLRKIERTYSNSFAVPVGPPEAMIAVAVIEPGNYGMVHSIVTLDKAHKRAWFSNKTDWTLPALPIPGLSGPRGTVLLLHGFQDSREDMMHWALFLAQKGFRVVLVDLRGHGHSTGRWIGYGAFETRDLEQVIDALQAKRLIAGRIGLLGVSYGASVGLQLAGHDPRVRAVVAIEPFANPRRAVVDFARAVAPTYVRGWSDQDFSNAEDRAARMAHFSWKDADVTASAAAAQAPILYVRGMHDHWVPAENTDLLARSTHGIYAVLTMTLSDGRLEDHIILSWLLDPIATPVADWLDTCLTQSPQNLRTRLMATAQAPINGALK